LRRIGLILSITVLLGGCGGGYAPVTDLSIGGKRQPAPVVSSARSGYYTVRRGDTLYSIAFRYGLDYRYLAKLNGIGSGNRIYAGQRLKLEGKLPVTSTVAKSSTTSKPVISRKADSPKPKTEAKSTSKKEPVAKPAASTRSKTSAPKAVPLRWKWPADGSLLARFSARGKVNKGIDIGGQRGDTVRAAAGGTVVYAGNGLLGYGNLIIINHNSEYLSAYGHNSRIMVTENDKVKVGEKIAEIGNTGATRNMLHFEIRKDGRPVNPLQYLPKK